MLANTALERVAETPTVPSCPRKQFMTQSGCSDDHGLECSRTQPNTGAPSGQ